MVQSINPDQPKFINGGDDNKDLLAGKNSLQIKDNDDEDILKNDAAKDAAQGKPLSLTELKEDMEDMEDMEDEDDLDVEAETTGLL